MKRSEIIERSQEFIAPYRVTSGKKFWLKDVDLVRGQAQSTPRCRRRTLRPVASDLVVNAVVFERGALGRDPISAIVA
jgi:hypothetical protein